MAHKDNIDLQNIELALEEVFDSYSYIKDYGYVGCYEMSPEHIKRKTDMAIELVRQANDYLSEVSESIRDSFEHQRVSVYNK